MVLSENVWKEHWVGQQGAVMNEPCDLGKPLHVGFLTHKMRNLNSVISEISSRYQIPFNSIGSSVNYPYALTAQIFGENNWWEKSSLKNLNLNCNFLSFERCGTGIGLE